MREKPVAVKNLWNLTTFYCGNGHEKPLPMTIDASSYDTCRYVCPDRTCHNALSIHDAEAVVDALSEKLCPIPGGASLAGYHGKVRTISFRVISHVRGHLSVEVLDSRKKS